jgi:hydroxypyruvate reductase
MMSHAANCMRDMFDAAIASAQPQLCVSAYLPILEELIGAGKASAIMVWAVEVHCTGRPFSVVLC